MKTILIAIIAIIAVSAVAATFILQTPAGQLVSQTQRAPSSQVQIVQVKQISASASSYSGKIIQIEGMVRKDFSLASPYLLSDSEASLSLKSNSDMDRYVGLQVRVTGVVKHDPQAFNVPTISIQIQTIQPKEEPSFYLEMEKHGVYMEGEDFGHRTLDRLLVFDNSRTLNVYATKSAFLQRLSLTKERVDDIQRALLAADIFSIQQRDYPMMNVDQGDTYTYRIKVIMKVGSELKENELKWEEPSPIPEKLQKLEAVFNNILKAGSP